MKSLLPERLHAAFRSKYMSEMTFNIIGISRTVSGYVHGSFASMLLAALAAEPERACERFREPDSVYNLFAWFYEELDDEPYDAGIFYVDLAARLIACESTYDSPEREGMVPVTEITFRCRTRFRPIGQSNERFLVSGRGPSTSEDNARPTNGSRSDCFNLTGVSRLPL